MVAVIVWLSTVTKLSTAAGDRGPAAPPVGGIVVDMTTLSQQHPAAAAAVRQQSGPDPR